MSGDEGDEGDALLHSLLWWYVGILTLWDTDDSSSLRGDVYFGIGWILTVLVVTALVIPLLVAATPALLPGAVGVNYAGVARRLSGVPLIDPDGGVETALVVSVLVWVGLWAATVALAAGGVDLRPGPGTPSLVPTGTVRSAGLYVFLGIAGYSSGVLAEKVLEDSD